MSSPIYGIDLGTTYSKCAVVFPGDDQPTVIPLNLKSVVGLSDAERGEVSAPLRSVVALGTVETTPYAWVGEAARGWHGYEGCKVIEESKAWIGEDPEEFKYRGALGAHPWKVAGHPLDYVPEDIGSFIIRRIKQIVDEKYPHYPMERVVITHPQRFEDQRAAATRRAGELVGLQVVKMLTEPDAAALAILGKKRSGVYLVFDMGGGTLDVTVARLDPKSMTSLGADGVHTGGRQFDWKVRDLLLREFSEASGERLELGGLKLAARAEWLMIAERFKQKLCVRAWNERDPSRLSVTETVDFIDDDGEQWAAQEITLRAEAFTRATEALVEECRSCAQRAWKQGQEKQGLQEADLAGVVMVGGSSRNPWVRDMLQETFKKKPIADEGLNTLVARGAAIWGGIRGAELDPSGTGTASGQSGRGGSPTPRLRDIKVRAILARGLGVLVHHDGRDVVDTLAPKGTPLPFSATKHFYTRHAGDTSLEVRLYEGESEEPEECTKVATCVVEGLPSGRDACQPVSVEIRIDESSSKTICARDQNSGIEAIAQLKYDSKQVLGADKVEGRRLILEQVQVCEAGAQS